MEDLPDNPQNVDQKIVLLFHKLGLKLPHEIARDTTRTDTQKYLDQIIVAADECSIHYDTFYETFDALRQGKQPDVKNWQQLEFFRKAIEPIFDARTKFPDGIDRERYFSWYFQNLKDKRIDFERLVKIYTQNHQIVISEALAIFSYTTIAVYEQLNYIMRKNKYLEQTAEFTKLLESGLSQMPTDDRTQYRAINIPEDQIQTFLQDYQQGKTVESAQFLSAANYPVEPFWRKSNIHLEIEPTNAHTITDLAFGTNFQQTLDPTRKNDTHESLFSHNARFIVVDVSEQPRINPETSATRPVYHIKLRQIK